MAPSAHRIADLIGKQTDRFLSITKPASVLLRRRRNVRYCAVLTCTVLRSTEQSSETLNATYLQVPPAFNAIF